MVNEIGSEFSDSSAFLLEKPTKDFSKENCTFSGRTSLYAAFEDILKEHKIKTVWMPSYCCSSMLQPINDLNLTYSFYSVDLDSDRKLIRNLDNVKFNDVVILMNYFGFYDNEVETLISHCKQTGAIVIEDTTHTLLMRDKNSSADYQIASLRKWFPIACGGYILKKAGNILKNYTEPSNDLINIKFDAMKQKQNYLNNQYHSSDYKTEFLEKFKTFNFNFDLDYKNKNIDNWSFDILVRQDIETIRYRRKSNAKYLLNNLKRLKNIKPLFTDIRENDCPLFVPIMVENRDVLHKKLISNDIFCPIHWPKPSNKPECCLYNTELSLICDQRYTEKDMSKVINVISQFDKEA